MNASRWFPFSCTIASIVAIAAVATACADEYVQSNALRVITPYSGAWTSAPTLVTTAQTTDAPLLGNGDVGVAITGTIDSMSFCLGKNEWWSLTQGKTQPLGKVVVSMPQMKGSSYSMQQVLKFAECTGSFSVGRNNLGLQSWMSATKNVLVTRLVLTGDSVIAVRVRLTDGFGALDQSKVTASGGVACLDVAASDNVDAYKGYPTRKGRLAARVIGAAGTFNQGTLTFSMSPTVSDTCYIVSAVLSNIDSGNYQAAAPAMIQSMTAADVAALNAAHRQWWADYYGKSFIEIPDKTIEKFFYGSLYLLGCCMRGGEYPPGLWGNWSLGNMDWNGDFTLNYNYEAPFFSLCNLNHADISACYDKPVLDWITNGQAAAQANSFSGLYYGVHIGPLPDGSADKNFWNQKSMTAFAAVPILYHWYYTADVSYANTVYDYLKQSALFWENYLQWDGVRYVIVNDAQHEGDAYPQTNGVMSLGLVRFLLQGCIDISTALNLDANKRTTWQTILSKMSAFPTFTRQNTFTGQIQTVFRYTETGRDWNDGNVIGCQHIYPASQIGLFSDSASLKIAWNMIDQMRRWNDGNGTNSFYPAAARAGYPADSILNHLKSFAVNNSYNNLHIHTGGGGIENLSPVPAGLCEMLAQSFQGKVKLFADWSMTSYAKFGDLGAYGGFLVSSDFRAGSVQYARAISNRGRDLVLVNPWGNAAVQMYRNGADGGTKTGATLTVATSAGDTLYFAPSGTSLQTIYSLMTQPAGPKVSVLGTGRAAGPTGASGATVFSIGAMVSSAQSMAVPRNLVGRTAQVEVYDVAGKLLSRRLVKLGSTLAWHRLTDAHAVYIAKVHSVGSEEMY